MKSKGFGKKQRLLGLVLVIGMVFILTQAPILEAKEADCQGALARCGVTAVMASIGSPLLGAAIASGCLIGYSWCLQYFN